MTCCVLNTVKKMCIGLFFLCIIAQKEFIWADCRLLGEMLMKYEKLTNENITAVSEQLYADLTSLGFKQKTAAAWRRAAEKIMLDYQMRFGSDTEFAYVTAQHFGSVKAALQFRCASFNPFLAKDNSLSGLNKLLSIHDTVPVWKWSGGENCVTVTAKKRRKGSGIAKMFASAAAALLCGWLSAYLPVSLQNFIDCSVVSPLFKIFMRAINCVAPPLIFLIVSCSIYNVGDLATLEAVGKKLLSKFMCHSALFLVSFILLLSPFFLVEAGGKGMLDLNCVMELLTGIVPNNIITPFSEGNTLQVLFLAVVNGLCMLILGKKTESVTEIVLQMSDMVQFVMNFIGGRLLSLFIFLSVYKITLSSRGAETGNFRLVLPLIVMPCLLAMFVCLLITSVRFKVSPFRLLKKQAAPTLIAFTTDSSFIATMPSIEVCREKLGIDENLSNFGVAMGNVMFRFAPACQYAALALVLAEIFAIPVTLQWLVIMCITAYVIALASPPVVGGRLVTCAIFSAQVGFPEEAASFLVMFMILGGFISIASKIFCTQHELIWLASDMGRLDKETLRA